jgi:hypothetical protein
MNWKEVISLNIKQCRLAFAAFFLMVLASYASIGFIMEENLANGAVRSLDTTGENINGYFSEADTVLSIVAQTVQDFVRRGESQEKIQQYLGEITDWLRRHESSVSFIGIYGFVRGEFIDSTIVRGLDPDENYPPQNRPWYQAAMGKQGETVFTDPYVDVMTRKVIITAARELFDENDNSIGIIALDTQISRFLSNG